MPPSKTQLAWDSEPVEQWLWHFTVYGIIGGLVLGPLVLILHWVIEFAYPRWWNFGAGQWPPKTDREPVVHCRPNAGPPPHWVGYSVARERTKPYYPASRVHDTRKDLLFKLAGSTIGITLHGAGIAIGWGVWG